MAGGASTGISVLQLPPMGLLQHPGSHDPLCLCLKWGFGPSNLHPYMLKKEESEGTGFVHEVSGCELF